MMKYEDYRGVGVQQPRRKEGLSEKSNLPEMRQPIRPKESMRDIMYSGVGVGVEEPPRVGSRVLFKRFSAIIQASSRTHTFISPRDEINNLYLSVSTIH